jgi:hypothetical protein
VRHALWILAMLLTLASANAAEVTFVSPLEGAQAIGPMAIEVTTNALKIDRVDFYVDGILAGVARRAPYRIAFDFGTDGKARTIVAKVLSNGFRTTDTATVKTMALSAGESINVDVVEVPLRVRSRNALKAADVRVRENGIDQTIREITPTRAPAHFAFVVDRSLSMGDGKLTAALRAVDAAMPMLRPGDTASVTLFNHVVAAAVPLRGATAAKMTARPSGGTSLRDAVSSIASRQRTYAIVITDGGDRNSLIDEEDALRRISGTKTVVSALVFGDASRFLGRATRTTGGTIANATADSISSALRNVLADINSRYTLVYQSRGTKNGWRTIDVAARRTGIEVVNARKGYFAE